jgi:AraC-like DNA-binding protein
MQLNAELAGGAAGWLDRNGYPIQPLLESLRIDRRDLAYGRRVSGAHFAAILDFGAAQSGDECFGLHRGGEFHLRDGGVLAYLAACADSLEEAVLLLKRYASVVCNGFTIELERDADAVVIMLHVSDKAWRRCRHLSEFFLARIVKSGRLVTGTHLRPLAVQFAHAPGQSDLECRRYFGCEVAFAAGIDAIKLPKDVLALPIPTADSRLGLLLRHYADELLRQVQPADRESLVGKATSVVARRLASGDVSLHDVAGRLHMTERTLRPRLRESGLPFNELVKRVRRDLANEWLQHGEFNVKHISYLLGYSDAAAFSRAYKRWTGRSPGQAGLA